MTEYAKQLRRAEEKMDRLVERTEQLTDAALPDPSRTREYRPDETRVEMLADRLDAVNAAFEETYGRDLDEMVELIEKAV